jgi:hypothetical protein
MNPILKQRIEEAANEYIQSDAVSPENMKLAFGDFINGAKWILQNQWISVDEALPEEDENVFVMNEYGGYDYAHYDYENKTWRMSSGENAEGSDEIYSTITHWMEIPKTNKYD